MAKTKDLFKPREIKLPNKSEKELRALFNALVGLCRAASEIEQAAKFHFNSVDDISFDRALEMAREVAFPETEAERIIVSAVKKGAVELEYDSDEKAGLFIKRQGNYEDRFIFGDCGEGFVRDLVESYNLRFFNKP